MFESVFGSVSGLGWGLVEGRPGWNITNSKLCRISQVNCVESRLRSLSILIRVRVRVVSNRAYVLYPFCILLVQQQLRVEWAESHFRLRRAGGGRNEESQLMAIVLQEKRMRYTCKQYSQGSDSGSGFGLGVVYL